MREGGKAPSDRGIVNNCKTWAGMQRWKYWTGGEQERRWVKGEEERAHGERVEKKNIVRGKKHGGGGETARIRSQVPN